MPPFNTILELKNYLVIYFYQSMASFTFCQDFVYKILPI